MRHLHASHAASPHVGHGGISASLTCCNLQANELLSLKPTLAKKLNDKIKSLQAEIEVLRSDTKVNELERKVQVGVWGGLEDRSTAGIAGTINTSDAGHVFCFGMTSSGSVS